MNKLRLIRYFAFSIIFCAEYRCAPSETWCENIRDIIDAASNVEPCEKIKGAIQNVSFEKAGRIVQSHAHESLTLIVNEHTVKRDGDESDSNWRDARVFYHFNIRSTNSNSRSESVVSFWNMHITSFVYFASVSSKIKLTLTAAVNKGIITMDFLNPGDAQLFWHYASKFRERRKIHMIDILKFEVFNRQTKGKVEESSFVVVHKERPRKTSSTYMISVESDGVTQKSLLTFSSGHYSVSRIFDDRMGLLVSDEPNMVFILQFSPFEDEAAVSFQRELYIRRCATLDPMSEDELRSYT